MESLPYRYFDPKQAGMLGSLSWVARTFGEGSISGLHRSRHHGFSAEFGEHRRHTPGDGLKYPDWVAPGHSEPLFVKRYERETYLPAHVLPANQCPSMKRPASRNHHAAFETYS